MSFKIVCELNFYILWHNVNFIELLMQDCFLRSQKKVCYKTPSKHKKCSTFSTKPLWKHPHPSKLDRYSHPYLKPILSTQPSTFSWLISTTYPAQSTTLFSFLPRTNCDYHPYPTPKQIYLSSYPRVVVGDIYEQRAHKQRLFELKHLLVLRHQPCRVVLWLWNGYQIVSFL